MSLRGVKLFGGFCRYLTVMDAMVGPARDRARQPDQHGRQDQRRWESWDGWLRDRCFWVQAGLWLFAFILYAHALANGFVSDDDEQIIQNPLVRNAHLWPRLFTGGVWSFQGKSFTNFYRPLHMASHWLVFRLAGPNPAAFHLYQLILFAATGCLVYRIGWLILNSDLAALAGTLLWMAHPQKVEAVGWIAATPDVGMGFFYALAFWWFLQAENRPERRLKDYAWSAIAYFPALFFKEMALSFPLMILAYWFFISRRPARGRAAIGWLFSAIATGVYLVVRRAALGHLTQRSLLSEVSGRLAAAAVGLLGQHAKLFLWPAHLSVYRAFELRSALVSPWPWLALGVLAAALLKRKSDPGTAFLISWWFVALLPCLDVRQLSVPFCADRFSYLPSVGPCMAIAGLLLRGLPTRLPAAARSTAALPALAALFGSWIFVTIRTIPNWRDNEVLMQEGLKQAPSDPFVHVAKAIELRYRDDDLVGARREYEEALRLNRSSWRPDPRVTVESYIGLGAIAQQEGRLDEALSYYHNALRLSSGSNRTYDALGAVYFPRGEYARAAEYFAGAARANPDDPGSRFYLGMCWMKLGRYRAAAEQFRAAAAIDPSYWQAYEAEAQAWLAAGDPKAAAEARRLAAPQP